MPSSCTAAKESSSKNSKAILPPRRGQVKVGIFRIAAAKVAGIASTVGLGRKRSRVKDEPASAPPLKIGACSLAEQEWPPDIKATFGIAQKHEFNVSTYQMCVPVLFNNSDRLSYKEIEQAVEIPASDLKRCLQSLACVKGKNVLRKEPTSKDIGEDDAFFVNDNLTSEFYKVQIGTVVAQRESEPEKQETRQRV